MDPIDDDAFIADVKRLSDESTNPLWTAKHARLLVQVNSRFENSSTMCYLIDVAHSQLNSRTAINRSYHVLSTVVLCIVFACSSGCSVFARSSTCDKMLHVRRSLQVARRHGGQAGQEAHSHPANVSKVF